MNKLFTVIYYTSNREDEVFEKKIRDRLWKAKGDLPLVSVSQKPIDFGTNVCIGEVGACEDNLFRQILIAAEVAKTPFVISTEADCLYPPDYFTFFTPPKLNDIYFINNVWMFYPHKKEFLFKGCSDCAQYAGREYLIQLLRSGMKGRPVWKQGEPKAIVYKRHSKKIVPFDLPIINIKTGHGMRPKTQVSSVQSYPESLPYFGSAVDLKKELFNV